MSATDNYRDLTRSVSANMASLRSTTPGVMKAFGELGRAATAPGALDSVAQDPERRGQAGGGSLRHGPSVGVV